MNPEHTQQVIDLAIGGWKAQVLFTSLELGIFDCLAEESLEAEEVAARCGLSVTGCGQLLGAAVAMGLLDTDGRTFHCSPSARSVLVKGAPGYLGGLVRHVDQDTMPLWRHLGDAVKEGTNRWKQRTGSEAGHFHNLYKDPEALEAFLETMHGFNAQSAEAVANAVAWRGNERVLDVGGATGVLGKVLLEHHPGMRVTLFDLPEVCEIARDRIRDTYGKADRMDTVPGNFLNDELPRGYDVLYLGWVLHDWDPETQVDLLTKCFEALEPGGRVLVTECPLAEDRAGPPFTTLLSLNMLVSADGGRESTAAEYRERFQAAGFPDVEHIELPVMRDLFAARKP